ncbi:hypothetical protein ACNKHX_17740 [Shigella flexneri]
MTVRVAINGFGRIGRNVVRALYESGTPGRKLPWWGSMNWRMPPGMAHC